MERVGASLCSCVDRLGALAFEGFKKQLEWRQDLTRRMTVCVSKSLEELAHFLLRQEKAVCAHQEERPLSRSVSPRPEEPKEPSLVPKRLPFWAGAACRSSPGQIEFDALFTAFTQRTPSGSPYKLSRGYVPNVPFGSEASPIRGKRGGSPL